MLTTTVHVPVSAAELSKLRAEELERNEETTRKSLAEANRKAGHPEPKPGAKLYVATARGIKTRGRAGLTFSEVPAEVSVIDADDKETLEKQKSGAYVVNMYGAEQIYGDANGADKGLVVFGSKQEAGTPTLANETTEALELELARRKAAPSMSTEPRHGARRTEGKTEK